MKNPDRDLLVLLKHGFTKERSIEKEVEYLNTILRQIESFHLFCRVHELVDRNYISSQPRKILNAIRFVKLKAFRFLINKN